MSSTETVTFNVGGKVYEVSKSLLQSFPENSVLVQKASTTESNPIFIDRDPDRFAYCLDYLRDNGQVHLADNVSKDSFLKELEFFGFENVDESLIQYDATSKRQTAARFHTNVGQFKCELDNMRDEIASLQQNIETLQNKVDMGELVLHCLRESTEYVNTSTGEMSFGFGHEGGPLPKLRGTLTDEAYFSECCERNGLQYVRIECTRTNYRYVVLRFAGREKDAGAQDSQQ